MSHSDSTTQDYDDAEKGLSEQDAELGGAAARRSLRREDMDRHPHHHVPDPRRHHAHLERTTAFAVVAGRIPAPREPAKKVTTPKPKPSRWILAQLWFNTYRKFFTFVTLLNLTGIILAALGRFQYAEDHLGALVLGNLLTAILMRNELFLRVLYTIAIYGLRSVRLFPIPTHASSH